MPFLCALGWHKASPFPRWENGFYFSKCDRCGRELVRSDRGGWAPLAAGGPAASRRKKAPLAALLLGGLLALGAALALLREPGTTTPEAEPPLDRPAPAQPGLKASQPKSGQAVKSPAAKPDADRGGGAVTASLLNCRAGPSEQAPVLRRLERGAPVRVLASRSEWLGVLHGQQRCWVRKVHIAPADDAVVEQGERAFLAPGPPAMLPPEPERRQRLL
jgi:hypothetical protein